MFHLSTLGGFSYQLREFADLDGFVPEPGDRPKNFRWEGDRQWDSQTWKEFLYRAQDRKHKVQQLSSLWEAAS
uniref:Uncharacterized protein n=1 Tax=Planktothricoides sp. SpSt-374 TaxID=2282167 RepID=A0A7C3VJX4_9CYAN